eukprot:6205836-Pleurochrysis_carterae.AAC.2
MPQSSIRPSLKSCAAVAAAGGGQGEREAFFARWAGRRLSGGQSAALAAVTLKRLCYLLRRMLCSWLV